MSVATSIEIRQFALAKESVRGTVPAAPAYFYGFDKGDEIDYKRSLLEDPAKRGVNAIYPPTPGSEEGTGKLKIPCRASSIGEFLQMLIGNPVSTEQASFTVVLNTNDTIDWVYNVNTVGTCVIAPGTYLPGTTHADAGSLCALIYAGMHGVDAAITEVAYSHTTGLFTITRSGTVLSLTFLSGTNNAKTIAPLIGFAKADQTGAAFYTGTIAVMSPTSHVFTPGTGIQLPSYGFYINRGLSKKQYGLGVTSKVVFSGDNHGHIMMEADLLAQSEAAYSGAWTPSYSESPILEFYDSTVKVAGSAPATPNVKSWTVTIENGMKPFNPMSQQAYPQDFLAAGPMKASGSMVIYFMDETERAKFIAGSTTSLEFSVASSQMVNGAKPWSLDLMLDDCRYKAFPFGDEDGYLGAKVSFEAYYNAGTSRLFLATLQNARSAY